MADNYTIKDSGGSPQTIAAKNVSGVLYPRKIESDGTNDILSGAAANIAAQSSINAQLSVLPGQWAKTHAPAVNTQATNSQAAGTTGVRHVCNWISCTLANDGTGSAQAGLLFNLRDGATGAGTILASFTLSVPATAGACQVLTLSGLNIPGTAATAMTLECASAPGAHTAASIAFGGFDCV
jgi:hypothetical protein